MSILTSTLNVKRPEAFVKSRVESETQKTISLFSYDPESGKISIDDPDSGKTVSPLSKTNILDTAKTLLPTLTSEEPLSCPASKPDEYRLLTSRGCNATFKVTVSSSTRLILKIAL